MSIPRLEAREDLLIQDSGCCCFPSKVKRSTKTNDVSQQVFSSNKEDHDKKPPGKK